MELVKVKNKRYSGEGGGRELINRKENYYGGGRHLLQEEAQSPQKKINPSSKVTKKVPGPPGVFQKKKKCCTSDRAMRSVTNL
jgi:hypothetical protein